MTSCAPSKKQRSAELPLRRMITIDQLNALRSRVEDLKGYLAIDAKRIEIAEEEKRTQDPEFWNNSKEAELVMKRLRTLKSWTQSFDACLSAVDDAQVLFEFMKAGEAEDSEAQEAFDAAAVAVEELEFKNMLRAVTVSSRFIRASWTSNLKS